MISIILSLLMSLSFAKMEFTSQSLVTKDLDQMTQLFQNETNPAKTDSDNKVEYFKNGIRILFSRPNDDGLIETVLGTVKYSLIDDGSYKEIFISLTDEAISKIKNSKESPKIQLTNWVILENIMSEFKPQIVTKDELAIQILTKIRDAKIEISPKLKNERKLTSMRQSVSPSLIAEKILPKAAKK